jgi:hypothetical protein
MRAARVRLALAVIGGLVASPAWADLPKGCVEARRAHEAAAKKLDDALHYLDRVQDGIRLATEELRQMNTGMAATGLAGGAPGVMQAATLARRATLEQLIDQNRAYLDKAQPELSALRDEVFTAQQRSKEVCEPKGIWDRLKAMVASVTSSRAVAGVTYPRPVHLFHVDRYFEPETATHAAEWTDTLIGADRGAWFISTDRIPDADGNVDIKLPAFNVLRRAHADQHFVFHNSREFCPRLQELKVRLDRDQAREYSCD